MPVPPLERQANLDPGSGVGRTLPAPSLRLGHSTRCARWSASFSVNSHPLAAVRATQLGRAKTKLV
jgi:hypothetical protein